jgi:hypothetical protein
MINDIFTTRSRPSRPDQHPQLYNSHLATTGHATAVRYAIDDDLWKTFTFEQVTKQTERLRETDRFWLPNHGGPFVVRLSHYAVSGEAQYTDQLFYDFDFDGDALTDITVVTRHQRLGSMNWTAQHRQYQEKAVAEGDEDIIRTWWEKDYLCVRSQVPQAEYPEYQGIAQMVAGAVVILLQDRTANKIEIEPKERSTLNLNFFKRRPQIPNSENVGEIVLTIPRRVYKTSGKTGKPHGPHRMHYRAEHVRQQPYGPRSATSYKEIVIPGMWINAKHISPADLGTPITRRNYRFKAVPRKEESHTS